jgi:prepilin-type N-terminal cleavage/methylation domain-containing protein/prepilin-type processing-associated H-X9-DG protein
MIRLNRSRQGFTLVELLVVIGIIAILIGILLPVLSKARESGIQMQCLSNLRQFAIADQMYVNQYNWHMPAWWEDDHAYNAFATYWGGLTEFRKAMSLPILNPAWGYNCYVTKKWYCPNAARGTTPAVSNPADTTHNIYFPLHFSYGMNVQGVDINSETGGNIDVWDPRATQADPSLPVEKRFHGFKPRQVRRPAEKIHFADAMYFVINAYGVGPNTPSYQGWHARISNYDLTRESVDADSNGKNTQRTIAWRHKGGANVAFFDGHGEWVRKDRLYNKDASGNIIRNDAMWNVMD